MTSTGVNAPEYLSSCSVFSSTGDYIQFDTRLKGLSLSNSTISTLAGNQAISTNALDVLGTMASKEFTKNFEASQIISVTNQENRCLRAPGAACHTDIECAPSKSISEQLNGLDPEDSNLYTSLNKYEIMFWQEKLVCGQEKLPGEDGYDLKNNRCCRERGNQITLGINYGQATDVNNTSIPGVDIDLNDATRYSRVSTMIDKLNSSSDQEPPLQAPIADRCSGPGCQDVDALSPTLAFLDNQWKTISTVNERTCCSGNWIRHFNSDDNGGGHNWAANKHQDIPKESFRCLNWAPCTGATCGSSDFVCDHVQEPDDLQCLIRETSNSEATIIFDWMNTLELTGVPQIAVKSEDFTDIRCKVDPDFQDVANQTGAANQPPPNIITPGNTAEYVNGGTEMYSAGDATNFASGIKKVFSEDTFSCCLPTGTVMNQGDDPQLCCTGFINGNDNQCALPDYTNVTVYFNRYISSAAKDIIDSQIDPKTGYIINPLVVENLACQQSVCASGTLARGISLSNIKTPGHESKQKTFKRFIDETSQATNGNGLADLYDAGLRWNDDIYCVPSDLASLQSADLKITICP